MVVTAFVAVTAAACGSSSTQVEYETIAAAVAATPDGGTVLVEPGTYVEEITIDRPVSLVADGEVNLEGAIAVVDTNDVSIEGLTIVSDQVGIYVHNSDDVRIASNVIVGARYRGIHVVSGSAEIVDNEIRQGDGPYAIGIHVANSSARPASLISGNVVDQVGAYGIAVNLATAEVVDNLVRGGDRAGLAVNEMSSVAVRGNTVEDAPRFGILVTDFSHAVLDGNTVSGATEPVKTQFYGTVSS